ncbi:maleylpyruvate isomerase N-terminal domain-containing protein [Kribbella monticola]|uniref:maleylpyruvate isomerase N-terminal domain-containing protein n=1 Tax=Kribbella monticola TaxID=2185285 RepID=UPI000DD3ACAA|nr:maleylpyruvate isomerase N-terminal domain-containing protein [Kribbella monticola]
MNDTRADFLAVARLAATLLREPSLESAWTKASALAEFSVGGLAGHLAFQVLAIPQIIREPIPAEPTITLLDHYARVQWIDAALDDDISVRIRTGGEQLAGDGPAVLADELDAAIAQLESDLSTAPDRAVRISLWGPWSLMLDDMLVTRMMELAVHADDLAVSIGVQTPVFPDRAVETVVDLLTRLAMRRHGQTPVLRALSRAERSPASITAF